MPLAFRGQTTKSRLLNCLSWLLNLFNHNLIVNYDIIYCLLHPNQRMVLTCFPLRIHRQAWLGGRPRKGRDAETAGHRAELLSWGHGLKSESAPTPDVGPQPVSLALTSSCRVSRDPVPVRRRPPRGERALSEWRLCLPDCLLVKKSDPLAFALHILLEGQGGV